MTVETHSLAIDFPEYREKIHELKVSNPQFARLFEEYNAVEREVRRIEEEVETPSDEYIEQVKQKRVHLKDQLYDMLKA